MRAVRAEGVCIVDRGGSTSHEGGTAPADDVAFCNEDCVDCKSMLAANVGARRAAVRNPESGHAL